MQYKYISLLYDFLNNIFSLAYFTVRMQYVTHITYKICVNRLLILLLRFQSTAGCQWLRLGRVKSYMQIFNYEGVSIPNIHVVQGSTVFRSPIFRELVYIDPTWELTSLEFGDKGDLGQGDTASVTQRYQLKNTKPLVKDRDISTTPSLRASEFSALSPTPRFARGV